MKELIIEKESPILWAVQDYDEICLHSTNKKDFIDLLVRDKFNPTNTLIVLFYSGNRKEYYCSVQDLIELGLVVKTEVDIDEKSIFEKHAKNLEKVLENIPEGATGIAPNAKTGAIREINGLKYKWNQ